MKIAGEKQLTVLIFAVENTLQNLICLNIDIEKQLTVLHFAVEHITHTLGVWISILENHWPCCFLLLETLKHNWFLNIDIEKPLIVLLFAVENINNPQVFEYRYWKTIDRCAFCCWTHIQKRFVFEYKHWKTIDRFAVCCWKHLKTIACWISILKNHWPFCFLLLKT